MAPVSRSARLGAEGLQHRARNRGAAVASRHEKRRRVTAAASDDDDGEGDGEAPRRSRKKLRLGDGLLARHAFGEGGAAEVKAAEVKAAEVKATTSDLMDTHTHTHALAGGAMADDDDGEDDDEQRVKGGNGTETDMDTLRPTARSSSQGRKLRSQEATRFKSELSAYFADYDEVIGNDAKEQRW
ncbi:hypothetical protein CDD80_2315 [Ophiocordyceps camponoti-rufipedis]|uniref:Uncharacterized protein n=1 Tax=Ophiocordyceps camponoti-rufipedis TaxID=2004952 RepID=A0A2C5YBR5_9HYPO|nr:hypothetical protein CDD80_2315 [Ophiocordyceps camponoti-rufipedis]